MKSYDIGVHPGGIEVIEQLPCYTVKKLNSKSGNYINTTWRDYVVRCPTCNNIYTIPHHSLTVKIRRQSKKCRSCNTNKDTVKSTAALHSSVPDTAPFSRKYLGMTKDAKYGDIGFPIELFDQFISMRL